MSDKITIEESIMPDVGQVKKPLVFISHDTRDAMLAEKFSKLLQTASTGILKSFRSSDNTGKQGIEYGVDWYPEIMNKLNQATDVVCLLTKNSLDRPWILYEAGVARGKLNTKVLGLALGIPFEDVNKGPFSQFQNCAYDDSSITKLVMQLLTRIPDSEPDEDTILSSVKTFITQSNELMEINEEEYLTENTSSAKLFEEIKEMYQDLPERISRSLAREKHRDLRHMFHPEMFHELMHFTKDKRVSMLVALSMFKDDFPWIYEAGKDILNVPSENKEMLQDRIHALKRLVEMTFRGPFSKAFRKKDMLMAKEMDFFHMEFLDRFLHELMEDEEYMGGDVK